MQSISNKISRKLLMTSMLKEEKINQEDRIKSFTRLNTQHKFTNYNQYFNFFFQSSVFFCFGLTISNNICYIFKLRKF